MKNGEISGLQNWGILQSLREGITKETMENFLKEPSSVEAALPWLKTNTQMYRLDQALTRSLTICKYISELVMLNDAKDLSIHVVGAEAVEAQAPQETFSALCYVLSLNGIRNLSLLLCGPGLVNLSPAPTDTEVNCSGLGLKLSYNTDNYDISVAKQFIIPDLVVCFHPGFWGYDSWNPTIHSFFELKTWIVFTSYNTEEREDDISTFQAVFNSVKGSSDMRLISTALSAVRNQYASTFSRESGIEGRYCVENQFAHAFHTE